MLSSVRRPPPQVTGISPKDGAPGTKVTIRGEDLGIDARDLIGLRICGVDCLLSAEWKSPTKIIARTGQAKGRGDIIVVTRSGGVGSSTVQFKGLIVQIKFLQESAVWVEESQTLYGRNRSTSASVQEHDDPLGICDESNETRFPESKLQELFPDGCGNTSHEDFVPEWYLLENHHGTSFEDLKAGLSYLKRKDGQRSEGPREFFKINLTTLLDCFDTMTEMHKKMETDKQLNPGGVTQPLEDVLKKSNESANKLFNEVLHRKDVADATRNTLGVLHRFKFLFNLPLTIERNIKKGDYDMVITDYTRAKSLFGDSEVKVFREVYGEVETRIQKFREMLYKKLMNLPSTVDEQKKLIRYLAHLEVKGDPAWECLVNTQNWLITTLHNCKTEHLEKDQEREVEVVVVTSPISPTRLSSSSMASSRQESTKTGKTPQKVVYVDHLTRLLTENLPDLWRLGQTYLSGKLLKGFSQMRVEAAKHNQFNQMVWEVIDLFSKLVRAAFLPHSLQNMDTAKRNKYGVWKDNRRDSPTGWLPMCVRCVRASMLLVKSYDLPTDSMDILQDLAFDMRTNCMGTLLKQAIDDIRRLHEKETWSVDADDERGGTTVLPALYENIVGDTLQQLQEVVHAKPGEMELFEDSETVIKQETADLCIKVLQSFSSTLEQLALHGNVDRDSLKGRRSATLSDVFTTPSDNMPSLDKRLIVMMSNCNHTREQIIPRLVESLEKHGYPETSKIHSAASYCYQSLDERLFDNYIEEKANPIIGSLEQNMYTGGFDWAKCPAPTGIKLYGKEALLGIIQVHSEVYSISPSFVPRVMFRLIEYVMDEISRLYQCVQEFGENGALQARLEILALDSALGRYKNEETCAALSEALNCIPEPAHKEDHRLIEDLLSRFQIQMKFHLMCFQSSSKSRKT